MNETLLGIIGVVVGALLGGVGAYSAAMRSASATLAATRIEATEGRREEWWRRAERAIVLAVSDDDREQVAGFTLLRFLVTSELATEADKRMLYEVGMAVVQEAVPDYLADEPVGGDTEVVEDSTIDTDVDVEEPHQVREES